MQPSASSSPAPRRPAPNPTLVRWATLIQIHGSQTAALEALLREAEELQRLRRAVRNLGLQPELLVARDR